MATEEPPEGDRPPILAFEVGGLEGLGGDVRLELDSRVTVLVGRNAVGKSLLLNGIEQAAVWAAFGPAYPAENPPRRFACELGTAPPMRYEYTAAITAAEKPDDFDAPPRSMTRTVSWTESGTHLGEGDPLWSLSDSTFTVLGTPAILAPDGLVGDVASPGRQMVGKVLRGVRIVSAGVPRRESDRREITSTALRRRGRRAWRGARRDRVDVLANAVVRLYDHGRETFDELAEVLRTIKVLDEIAVKIYDDPSPTDPEEVRRDYATVLIDGVNVGLCSDGTLRVIELVVALLRPSTCLFLEEPETAIHPGLLAKLLNLVDSYSLDRQVVMSTHSHEVVDHFSSTQLRLVDRTNGKTGVRPLCEGEHSRIRAYLNETGTLGEYLFERSSS